MARTVETYVGHGLFHIQLTVYVTTYAQTLTLWFATAHTVDGLDRVERRLDLGNVGAGR
jgi:hypothetical protein